MFNLIMISTNWKEFEQEIHISRMFEYTNEDIKALYQDNAGNINLNELSKLPCLFMNEGTSDEEIYIGTIRNLRIEGQKIRFEPTIDSSLPTLQNKIIYENKGYFNINHEGEFTRNHWAVKDADVFRFLVKKLFKRRQQPKAFSISEFEKIDPNLISIMMPFSSDFNGVLDSVRKATKQLNLKCSRADDRDIWLNPHVIQDIVSLIDKSRIVICDCTNKNPNVLYEIGIAQTLGRDIILITQNDNDIPFDLRSQRYIKYLNNDQGRETLYEDLKSKIAIIIGH